MSEQKIPLDQNVADTCRVCVVLHGPLEVWRRERDGVWVQVEKGEWGRARPPRAVFKRLLTTPGRRLWIRQRVGHEPIFLNFAAAFVLDDTGKLLLQKRGDKHDWGLPGGALELGESAEEAVVREVLEETGLRVKVDAFQGVYTQYFDEYPNGDQAQTIAIFFICSILGGELQIDHDETLDLQFFQPADAPILFNQQSRDAFADFMQGKRGICC